MKIALIGYGKMGKAIERIALSRGHEISVIIDADNSKKLKSLKSTMVDVAIEFTEPEQAYNNIKHCIKAGIPVVSGTTGWLDKFDKLTKYCHEQGGSFFYASNYSIGMNLFFHINELVARLMNKYTQYEVEIHEVHHKEKKDAPSGSAISIARKILPYLEKKRSWTAQQAPGDTDISILSFREGNVPGTHTVIYSSPEDNIELKHLAHSRQGFATGAVVAAEWLKGKKGVFGMDDLLELV
jgi:4-hydroxy-tetrahydrodipicolinate reductase